MKKILLTAVCIAVLSGGLASVKAEEIKNVRNETPKVEMTEPKKGMVKRHEKLAERLKLTDEQKTKADEIRKAGREKMNPLIRQEMELRKEMDIIRSQNMEEFESILTDEQKTEFQKIKNEKRKRDRKPRRAFRSEIL